MASQETMIVLSEHARHELRRTLKNYCFTGYAPLGVDKAWWTSFARGRIREVPIATWRTVCAWYPDTGKALAAVL